ncbi:hypothetical protein EDD11_006931 [Mortierella claussenii]|nr:hypothetical protein EDD11_006931 [Mortierella claussenii]
MYTGHLYSIDPETRTALILLHQEQKQTQSITATAEPHGAEDAVRADKKLDVPVLWTMVAIRQHALKAFKLEDNTSSDRMSFEEMDTIAHISHKLRDPAEIQERKDKLVAMLRSKRIPVETAAEDPVVHIMNSAHVHPPYLPVTIDCDNGVVRERVKGMIQAL